MKIWIAVALLVATAAIDLYVLRVPLFYDGVPIFSSIYLLRSVFILLASALLVTFVDAAAKEASQSGLQWDMGGDGSVFYRATVGVSVLLSLSFVVLLWVSAEAFYRFGLEDNLLENLSALMWFAAAGMIALVIVKMQRKTGVATIYKAVATGFALVYFVIGMEEVSWFQRVIEFETPEALREPHEIFEGNLQGEANLHNLSTTFFENAFYFSMFVLFILFPFILYNYPKLRESRLLYFFVPGCFLVLIGALQVAFNYDMWNGILIQFAFYTTLLVLLHTAVRNQEHRRLSLASIGVALTILITQVAFLSLGDTLVRLWDVTEYKEFFIPLASLLYAVELFRKSRDFDFSGDSGPMSAVEAHVN